MVVRGWVLVGYDFVCFSKGFGDFVGLLGTAGPPVPLVPLAFVFLMFCKGFRGSSVNPM